MPSLKVVTPWIMEVARAALGPILLLGQTQSWPGPLLAAIVAAALISDIFDGILARRWQCDTPAVRVFDTIADTVFYLFTALTLYRASPDIWRYNLPLFLTLFALEATRLIFDFAKFRRIASYHSYLAKTWGLVMAIGVVAVFALHRSNLLIPAALILGIFCDLEGLAMSIILPTWQRDVKTLPAALRLRREILLESGTFSA